MNSGAHRFITIVFFVSLVGISVSLGIFFFLFHNAQLVDFSVLDTYRTARTTIVLDSSGRELFKFSADRRSPISFEKMPVSLIQAFVATEDRAFWKHNGISCKSIVRAFVVNCYNRRFVQGASTIPTHQLVKLLFLDSRKTVWRKIKEQLFTFVIEHHYAKEQILQAYLNNVYFGAGIYGVETAAQRFWSKSAVDLTAEEAATLAGIVRSPNNYCPVYNSVSAQKDAIPYCRLCISKIILRAMSMIAAKKYLCC